MMPHATTTSRAFVISCLGEVIHIIRTDRFMVIFGMGFMILSQLTMGMKIQNIGQFFF